MRTEFCCACAYVCVQRSFREVLILEDSVLLLVSIANDQKLLQVFIWSQV